MFRCDTGTPLIPFEVGASLESRAETLPEIAGHFAVPRTPYLPHTQQSGGELRLTVARGKVGNAFFIVDLRTVDLQSRSELTISAHLKGDHKYPGLFDESVASQRFAFRLGRTDGLCRSRCEHCDAADALRNVFRKLFTYIFFRSILENFRNRTSNALSHAESLSRNRIGLLAVLFPSGRAAIILNVETSRTLVFFGAQFAREIANGYDRILSISKYCGEQDDYRFETIWYYS